jgi:hypothetical protein
MKKPAFWKLSMGHGDFNDILEVIDWLRQGLVLAHSQTSAKKGDAAGTPLNSESVRKRRCS